MASHKIGRELIQTLEASAAKTQTFLEELTGLYKEQKEEADYYRKQWYTSRRQMIQMFYANAFLLKEIYHLRQQTSLPNKVYTYEEGNIFQIKPDDDFESLHDGWNAILRDPPISRNPQQQPQFVYTDFAHQRQGQESRGYKRPRPSQTESSSIPQPLNLISSTSTRPRVPILPRMSSLRSPPSDDDVDMTI